MARPEIDNLLFTRPLIVSLMNFDQLPDGLAAAIVQDAETRQVLMLGYMNHAAFEQTIATRLVTFYSRSRQRLWVKGETSGHHLHLVDWAIDCDGDALLLQVRPIGPTCHTGTDTCWGRSNTPASFLKQLGHIIAQRQQDGTDSASYTAQLLAKGTHKMAQKVGEEAVEVVIEALRGNRTLLLEESADLLYHLSVLWADQGVSLADVEAVLAARHTKVK
jgi:phosphoribosyl-AMP cyclohydrolase / phosphoribosyl-ATP pyrophosphohydrolase